jgi:hypothetical protein
MLKKYKLWYLLCAGIFCFMSLNFVLFALTGISIIHPSSTNQGMMQFCVFIVTGFITLVSSDGVKT